MRSPGVQLPIIETGASGENCRRHFFTLARLITREDTDPVQNRLLHIATNVRAFLEPVWPKWHQARGMAVPDIPSSNTCGRSSLFLTHVLHDLRLPSEWANGIPRDEEGANLGPYGFFSGSRWESHSWAECEGYVIDVTADQFGGPPVIVTPTNDPRYGEHTQDAASEEAKRRRQHDVEAIWPMWLEAPERRHLLYIDCRRCCPVARTTR
jgi:hypothetical protein